MLGDSYPGQDCALAAALDVLGERWTLLVVRDAFFGVRRFEDFARHLDIPRAVLSSRLRKLVASGVLAKVPEPDAPGRVGYRLTPAGEDLWPALYALISWGSRHRHPSSRRYRHAPCGTDLDRAGACPSCGTRPPARDVEMALRRAKRVQGTDPVSVALRRPHRLLEPLDTASVRETAAAASVHVQ